jgi:hypothetical protein
MDKKKLGGKSEKKSAKKNILTKLYHIAIGSFHNFLTVYKLISNIRIISHFSQVIF